MGLSDIEIRLERLVEGAFGRLSRKGIQPSEIGKKLVRQMELEKRIGVRGPMVPNEYLILLSPADSESLKDINAAVHSELLSLIQETARERRYKFVGFVRLEITEDNEIARGAFAIESKYQEDPNYLGHLFLEMPNGLKVPVTSMAVTVGRMPGSTIVIDDSRVSRRHAEIGVTDDGSLTVRDLGSTNGTKVNGIRISETTVTEGDEIEFGGIIIRVGRQ